MRGEHECWPGGRCHLASEHIIRFFTYIMENAASPDNLVYIFNVAFETFQEASKSSFQLPEAVLNYPSVFREVVVKELLCLRCLPQFWIGHDQMWLQRKRLVTKYKCNTSADGSSDRLNTAES